MPESYYKHIDGLFSDDINWELIETHLPDLLRIVLSVKNGTITASIILGKLNTYSHKNKLYQAFRELGRVIRTGFLSVTWNTAHQQEKTGMFFLLSIGARRTHHASEAVSRLRSEAEHPQGLALTRVSGMVSLERPMEDGCHRHVSLSGASAKYGIL